MNMIWFWIIVAIAAAVIEIVTLGNLICIWFTVGAAVSAVLAVLKVATPIQYFAFFAVSIAAMLIIRPMSVNYLRGNVVPTNADKLIGKTAHLTKDITSEAWGELVISGMTWSCISLDNEPIKKDTKVRIMAIEGVKLIVKPIDEKTMED